MTRGDFFRIFGILLHILSETNNWCEKIKCKRCVLRNRFQKTPRGGQWISIIISLICAEFLDAFEGHWTKIGFSNSKLNLWTKIESVDLLMNSTIKLLNFETDWIAKIIGCWKFTAMRSRRHYESMQYTLRNAYPGLWLSTEPCADAEKKSKILPTRWKATE